MASAFEKFGTAVPETESKNLGLEFSFDGNELERDNERSLYRKVAPGDYDFKVHDLEFRQSPKGTDYVYVTLSIQDEEGEARLSDSLFCTEKAKWKMARYFASLGMWDDVKTKGVTTDAWRASVNKTGRATIGTRAYTDKNGVDRETNSVTAYISPGKAAVR